MLEPDSYVQSPVVYTIIRDPTGIDGWWRVAAVEFRVLGGVEVRVDDHPADIGHTRQRNVLAALLVDADRVVPIDQLAYRLWDDSPPSRARDILYTYLSRLRHALASAAGVPLCRQRGGYRLAIDPILVDLHRFEHLVDLARGEAPGAVAAGHLQAALALWQGDPLSTLDTPWAAGIRDALRARRHAALLEGFELDLARGEPGRVLAGSGQLVQEHPLDERLAGQRILALYQTGRAAEAVQDYHRLRSLLAEELGTDPGPALSQLYQRILSRDPELTVPVAGAGAAREPVPALGPRQLPCVPAAFTGRTRELSILDDAVRVPVAQAPSVAVAAIVGAGGIGKTWLALAWAQSNVDRFPDGQLHLNLRGFDPVSPPLEVAPAVRALLDALGVPAAAIPVDLDAQLGLYRAHTAARRLLIVLDNARDSAQVAPLLPGHGASVVLVTSRNQLPGLVTAHGARSLSLDLLPEPEAHLLLSCQIGAARVAAEPVAVATLLRVCAGLPLALGIVAARVSLAGAVPLADLAAELDQRAGRLDGLDAGELSANLRAVFTTSYRTLPAAAARLFRLLGLAAGADIGVCAAASLAGLAPDRVRPVLRQLTSASLVQEHRPGRYRLHDLVRLYAAELARDDGEGTEALGRLVRYHLHTAHAATTRLCPQGGHPDPGPCRPGVYPRQPADAAAALAWFQDEHRNLLAIVELAASLGRDESVWQLAWLLTTYLDRQGHWADRVATQRAALVAAGRAGDRYAQAHSLRGLASAYIWLGRFDEARRYLGQAVDLFVALADQAGQASCHRSLARTWAQQDRHDLALPHDLRAVALFRASGARSGLGHALNAVGWHYAHLGEYARALRYCRAALREQRALNDRRAQGATWDSLGYIEDRQGRYPQAIACYERALRRYRETGDVYYSAETLGNLGDTYLAAGQPRAARQHWEQAADILDALGHPGAARLRARLASGVAVAAAPVEPVAAGPVAAGPVEPVGAGPVEPVAVAPVERAAAVTPAGTPASSAPSGTPAPARCRTRPPSPRGTAGTAGTAGRPSG